MFASFHSAIKYYANRLGSKDINGLVHCCVLHDTILTCQVRVAHLRYSAMMVMGVTNHFLLGFNVSSIGENSCLMLKVWSEAQSYGCYRA